MKIVNKIKNIFNKEREGMTLEEFSEWHNKKMFDVLEENPELTSDLAEIIYFICLKHLSETLGKMPWDKVIVSEKKGKEKLFDGTTDRILNIRPNPYMNALTFWQTVEMNRLHYGNAYIYTEMDSRTGKLKNLWQLPSQNVEIWVDNAGYFKEKNAVWYVWTDSQTGKRWRFEQSEIIHLKTHVSFDGMSGLPVRDILRNQMNMQKNSAGFLKKLYKQNMFGSKIIIHYTGDLEDKSAKKLVTRLEKFSTETGTGKFIPLPFGVQAQPIDMKLSDAQFFENNKLTALQLAAAFGIKPNIINDYTKSSYSNSQTQQVDFYVNTLQPLFAGYEQEMTYKLLTDEELEKGIRYKINEKILFKMDNKTLAEVSTKLVGNFIMTPNEAREEIGLPYVEGGDKLVGNGNFIDLEKVGTQYLKNGGGEQIENKS